MKRKVLRGSICLVLLVLGTIGTLHAQAFKERLSALEGVVEIKELPAGEFVEKYEVMLCQPLDIKRPEVGSFRQRVVVMHVGEDRPTMLITQGYGAGFALRPTYREEISRLFNTNMVFVEHRYFDRSMPENPDWRWLTAENSAHDLHRIKTLFATLYPGKWIASGISKGGTTTMLYATFYPGDVDLYVPYVGPICSSREDRRFAPFFAEVSTPENRERVEAYQRELLMRRERLLPGFEAYCSGEGMRFRLPIEEIYDYCVLEYAFSFWQWGMSLEAIPSLEASDRELLEHLIRNVGPDYFAIGGDNASFYVQAAKELGYYPYDLTPFKGLLAIESSKDYLRRIFLPEELARVKFDRTLYRKMCRYLKRNDPRMLLVYGEFDPWTAPGATWVAALDKENMHLFIDPEGSHRARILTLPEAEQREAIALLEEWLGESACR